MISQASQASSTVHGMKKLEFQVFFFLVLLVEFNFLLLFLFFLEDVQASFFPPEMFSSTRLH
jgi:hypothetical protein